MSMGQLSTRIPKLPKKKEDQVLELSVIIVCMHFIYPHWLSVVGHPATFPNKAKQPTTLVWSGWVYRSDSESNTIVEFYHIRLRFPSLILQQTVIWARLRGGRLSVTKASKHHQCRAPAPVRVGAPAPTSLALSHDLGPLNKQALSLSLSYH